MARDQLPDYPISNGLANLDTSRNTWRLLARRPFIAASFDARPATMAGGGQTSVHLPF